MTSDELRYDPPLAALSQVMVVHENLADASLVLYLGQTAVVGRQGASDVDVPLRDARVVSRRCARIRCTTAGAIVRNLADRRLVARREDASGWECTLELNCEAVLGSGSFVLRIAALDGSIDHVRLIVRAAPSSAARGVPTGEVTAVQPGKMPESRVVLAVLAACAVRDDRAPQTRKLQRTLARYENRQAEALTGARWNRLLVEALNLLGIAPAAAAADRLTTIAHQAYGMGYAKPSYEQTVKAALRERGVED